MPHACLDHETILTLFRDFCRGSYTNKYNIHQLVHYEIYDDAKNAIRREKRLKKYRRDTKIKLIEKENKNWNDLYDEICQ